MVLENLESEYNFENRYMPPNEKGRLHTEEQLINHALDFSAAYMAVQYLATHITDYPETITSQTIEALVTILESDRFSEQKQILFLYIETADTMVSMARQQQHSVSCSILPRLQTLLSGSSGQRLRAVGQALGKLPVRLCGPEQRELTDSEPMPIELADLMPSLGQTDSSTFVWKGRSLVILNRNRPCGVIKFAKSQNNAAELIQEVRWLAYLNNNTICIEESFQVPIPVKLSGRILFQLSSPLPGNGPAGIYKGICIAFIPCPGYFDYPNEHVAKWSSNQIETLFFKNARLLGSLTAKGIFHTALIPLFHNRVQRGRRNDNGAYLWEHGGRLDQWLDSCRFPNFAASGLRDFEHLTQVKNSRQLRHYIGEHLLSFTLVIGSYFRNHDPIRRGKDKNQCPSDTRDLFSRTLFSKLLIGVSHSYFQGLVQQSFPSSLTSHLSRRACELTNELIGTMGRDENMEETLRIRDQARMTNADFRQFLKERGITEVPVKGETDLILETGPHLGGFNQPISVPGLIDYLFWFSALCVSHCFIKENKLKA